MATKQAFESIKPWDGSADTGKDVRLKLDRNFEKIAEKDLDQDETLEAHETRIHSFEDSVANKGRFATSAILIDAWPIGKAGWNAFVEDTSTTWNWNSENRVWEDSGLDSSENSIKYVSQVLSPAQKNLARTNIGAASSSALSAIVSGGPRMPLYASLADLNAADPDHRYTYITTDNGNWNAWDGLAFASGGIYQTVAGYVLKNEIFNTIISPNLFDKTQVILDSILNDADGTVVTAGWTAGYAVSGFMPISALSNAISNKVFTWIVFCSGTEGNEVYISGISQPASTAISSPADTTFFRIAFPNVPSVLDTLQVESGIVSTPYQPYGTTTARLFKNDEDIDDDYSSESPTHLASAREVKNLYDISNPRFATITARRYSGGDFNGNNAIQDAIDSITDASETNQYIIDPKGYFVAYLPEHYTGTFSVLKSFIQLKPWVHLISKNRNDCVIHCTLANNLGAEFPYALYQAFNHNVENSRVEGVDVQVSNIRYAVHIDGNNVNYKIPFRYCKIWNKGNTGDATNWGSPSPFGIGMSSGMQLLIEDCEVKGIDYALYAHTNNTFSEPSEIKFKRCKIITTNSQNNIIMYVQPLGSGCSDRFIVEDCQVDEGGIDIRSTPWFPEELVNQRADHAEYEIILPCMNPRPVTNSFLSGRGLRIKSKSTGAGSIVTIDPTSSAFDLIIGNSLVAVNFINRYNRNQVYDYQYKYGGNGLSGYAIGTLDIGQYQVGASVNKYIGALGKRLGNCSVVNKTLTVSVDGISYNIVFNKNYNGTAETIAPTYSNAQIIAEIVAVIGGVATVDEYCVGQDYYPQFKGVTNMVNGDTSEVLAGMGIVFTSLKIFRKALNSDGRIDGICLDDGRVGDECRIITEGQIWSMASGERFSVKESSVTTRAIGVEAGISATTAGVFDVTASPKVLRIKNIPDVYEIL